MQVRSLSTAFVLAGVLFSSASAQEGKLRPRWRPAKSHEARILPAQDPTRIVLKLQDGSGAWSIGGRLLRSPGGADLSAVKDIVESVPGTVVEPLFPLHPVDLAEMRLEGERNTGEELADLSQFFQVRLPKGVPASLLLPELLLRPEVENAYAAPRAFTPAGDISPPTPDFTVNQGYRYDLEIAWLELVPGGKGQGVRVCDVEGSWNLKGLFGDTVSHEDLMGLDAQCPKVPIWSSSTWANPFSDTHHGTAVLGVLAADVDAYGVSGIVPGSKVHVSAAYTTSGWNVAGAITKAAQGLGPGGVILIELQVGGPNYTGSCSPDPQFGSVPIEYWDAEFNAIQQATALRIQVVEAAGNGSQDLDNLNGGANGTPCVSTGDPSYTKFNLAVRNSGAIFVGASPSAGTLQPLGFSNRGTRVDANHWGENVMTLGYGNKWNGGADQLYTDTFGGTSSASSLIAGVASIFQAIHREMQGDKYFLPHAQRLFLRTTGNPTNNPPVDRIGQKPSPQQQVHVMETGPNPAMVFTGAYGTYTGYSVSGAGDVNADGYGDVVVGSPFAGSFGGQAYVLSGATGGILYTFQPSVFNGSYYGSAVSGAGDVNADGFDDVLVGHRGNAQAFVYSGQDGSVLYTLNGTGGLGQSLAGAGDVNGDGYDDFLAGAPFDTSGQGSGRAFLYSGQSGSVIFTFDENSTTFFGASVSGAGDVNSDGTLDLVVGSSDSPLPGTARAYVYSGSTGLLLYTLSGPGPVNLSFDSPVSGAGAVNQDGYDDILLGIPKHSGIDLERGRVLVFSGQNGQVLYTLDGEAAIEWFGWSVASLGDVNGDGYSDFVVGAPRADQNLGAAEGGKAYLYSGKTGGLLRTYRSQVQTGYNFFGWDVASAGDIDGNGVNDLIVGANQYTSLTYAGRAYTYLSPLVTTLPFQVRPKTSQCP